MSDSTPSPAPKTGPGVATGAAPTQTALGRAEGAGRPPDKIPRDFGRYRIIDCLGRGGMGAVFKAHDNQLDRQVALKVPFLENEDKETRERFYREARTAATLQHANICPVFDVGEFNGMPYITMAFIEGRSLADARKSGQVFTPAQIALLVRKVALAMQEAHVRGIIHRDLKPANILMKPNGEPIVMDFGLARRMDEKKSDGLTKQGDVIGTVDYMSPEQVEGDLKHIGPPTDIYALGVILYEMLTGRRPFEGPTTSILAQILVKQAPRPSELKPDVPPKLEEICLKAMAKVPADRYVSMALFAAALADFLRNPQQPAAPTAPPPSEAARATPPPSANTQPIPPVPTAPNSTLKNKADFEVHPSGIASRSGVKSGVKSGTRSGTRRSGRKKKKEKSQMPLILGISGLVLAFGAALACGIIFWPRGDKTVAQTSNFMPTPPPNRQGFTPPPSVSRPTSTTPSAPTKPSPPKNQGPGFAMTVQPAALNLAIGRMETVMVKVDRQDYKGPIAVNCIAPPGVRVTPGGPVTLKPEQSEQALKLLIMAEVANPNLQFEIEATPSQEASRPKVKSNFTAAVLPGPCVRILEIPAEKPPGNIEAMAFTPDANLVLLGGGSGKAGGQPAPGQNEERNAIAVLNLERGEIFSMLSGHTERVIGLAVASTPAGPLALSAAADETVATWDLTQGKLKRPPQKAGAGIQLIAMSADGARALIAVRAGVVSNTPVGAHVIKMLTGDFRPNGIIFNNAPNGMADKADDAVRALAVSADHKLGLIGGLKGKLTLVDMLNSDPKKLKPLVGHSEIVLAAAFSPTGPNAAAAGGGKLQLGKLVAGEDYSIHMWNVATGTEEWKGEGHTNSVVCLAFSPDGSRLASGAINGEIRVWDAAKGTLLATLPGHSGRILGMAFSPDSKRLWSGAADRTLRQWRLEESVK